MRQLRVNKITILVFGSHKFLSTLPAQVRQATDLKIEMITVLNKAISYIQAKPPGVILVQASLDGSMELCSWLKDQTRLSWIYCILFEDRPHKLELRNKHGRQWELEMTSMALKQGADAYIWQFLEDETNQTPAELAANQHLTLAQLTVGLRNAQKYRDLLQKNDFLSAIALVDQLTDLKNRRALEMELPEQINRARTLGMPLGLIILDVDYFKKVNDAYGHIVGDRVLQYLAKRLQKTLRFQDIPFRYGGEEFVVILANTTPEEALAAARRLNCAVNSECFVMTNQLKIYLTISLGIASLQLEDDPQGLNLLQRADQCLLAAKAKGRNQAISWDDSQMLESSDHPLTTSKF